MQDKEELWVFLKKKKNCGYLVGSSNMDLPAQRLSRLQPSIFGMLKEVYTTRY